MFAQTAVDFQQWNSNCAPKPEPNSFDMADDESSSTSDESLDVKSVKFDPMKALYSRKIDLSVTKAPIYDNVSKFETVMSGLSGQMKKNVQTTAAKQGECSRQRFLPHQEPVAGRKTTGERGRSIEGRNVLAKMQRTFGPLGMLHGYMENRTRVKVYTRNARGIRGHVEAYVAAFDKHWNLALEDCFEVWTRKVKRKAPALELVIWTILVILASKSDVIPTRSKETESDGLHCIRFGHSLWSANQLPAQGLQFPSNK
ncbi:U7 snRNA-associated Sm-like protein LSm11 [Melipona quadrifasciata]|uniref:U7 snRNA-associated Sm-like protein LSm11 n=1 Tax=Melipona quadrifasciata TaxID=166423 RepID=A0A0M9A8H7_9HYME|nr:U7 snRNA-associated Sm-like protein LSm11 [Melipona quadrifasciata]